MKGMQTTKSGPKGISVRKIKDRSEKGYSGSCYAGLGSQKIDGIKAPRVQVDEGRKSVNLVSKQK